MRNPFNFAAPGALTRCAILVLGLTTAAHAAPASTFQTIYYLGNNQLISPDSLAVGPDGTVYGTGLYNGNVFALTPPKSGQTAWSATNIWTFDTSSGPPLSGVIMGAGGNLYGVLGVLDAGATFDGGVYALAKSSGSDVWRETTFYKFPPNTFAGDSGPEYDLVPAKDGVFYGLTGALGSSDNGTIFKLTPPAAGKAAWTEQVLFSFRSDGSSPSGPLLMDSNGALYGVSQFGGPRNFGVVYKLTPPISGSGAWTHTVLHAFKNTDGAFPVGRLVMDSHGAIYGAASYGGSIYHPPPYHNPTTAGVVFKLTPPAAGKTSWTVSLPYVFKGGADGQNPYAGLVMDKSGALYGTTFNGGIRADGNCDLGCGVVFKLTPPRAGQTKWTKTVLHAFTDGLDGRKPGVDLTIDSSGALYGATFAGGSGVRGNDASNGRGTVFKIAH